MNTSAKRLLAAAALAGAALAPTAAHAAAVQPSDINASGLDTSLPTEQLPAGETLQSIQEGAAWTLAGLMFGEDWQSMA